MRSFARSACHHSGLQSDGGGILRVIGRSSLAFISMYWVFGVSY